jgi:hypothetical protein
MKLALRATASSSATWLDRLFACLTRWRLCSQWCHGAIVIGDCMYQANAQNGLHVTTDFDPARWTLIDLGPQRDELARRVFQARDGTGYDWLGVLGFALPWVRGQRRKMYCFEWCAMAMGVSPHRWMTPERLLTHALRA